MMDSSNPMSVKFYSSKLEFQGRGAPHIHGTMWVDMEKMEFMMENTSTKDDIEVKHLLNFE